MALALEGTPKHNNATSGTSLVTSAFTTTVATEVFIAATINGATISSITGGGLTWALRKGQGVAAERIELWAAPASGSLSGVQFTINLSAGVSFITTDVFAFSGNDTSTVWDANASVPASGTADPLAMTTSNANDVIIGAFRFGATANPTAGSGFTKISGADFQLTEYQIVAVAQLYSITVGTGVGNANECVGDALMAASSGGSGRLVGGSLVNGSLVGSLA